MSRLLIVGCGYVGKRVAARWLSRGGEVLALSRGGDSAAELAQMGISVSVGDWLSDDWQLAAGDIDAVLVAVPHRADDRYGQRTHVVGLEQLVKRLPDLTRLVVYSTTGVYHQSEGETVDEDSPAEPTRIGPQIAQAAERWLAEHLPVGIATSLRLAGIYGPGRIPLLAKLRSGEPLPVPREGCLNLIHVDDIATATVGMLDQSLPRRLYVLSDGNPVERREFYLAMADIFATEPPNFVEPAEDSSRSQRAESNKRIKPDGLFSDLNFTPQFPSYRDGLEAIARSVANGEQR